VGAATACPARYTGSRGRDRGGSARQVAWQARLPDLPPWRRVAPYGARQPPLPRRPPRTAPARRPRSFTWPVWMYVSVTGVLLYLMLYHLAPALHG
jgi:hypothetical protein